MDMHFRKSDGLNSKPVSAAAPLPITFVDGTATAVAAVAAAGTGYAPSDTCTLAGGEYSTPTLLTVTHTKVVGAVVKAGGTGGTPGAVTITGTTGTGTPFQATGVITAGGVLAGALTVTVPGDYTVNPTSIATEPVTGGSLSGCTVTLVMGVLTVALTTAGQYAITPTNPVAQASTSGSGTGATFTMTYSAASLLSTLAGLLGGKTFANAAASPLTCTASWQKAVTTTTATKGLRIAPIASATTYDIEWVAVAAGASAPTDTSGEPILGGEDFASGFPIGDIYLKSATGQIAIVRSA